MPDSLTSELTKTEGDDVELGSKRVFDVVTSSLADRCREESMR